MEEEKHTHNITKYNLQIPIYKMEFTLKSIFDYEDISNDDFIVLSRIIEFVNSKCPDGYKFVNIKKHPMSYNILRYIVTYIPI